MLSKIEQKAFFPIVRFVVFGVATILLITMVVGLIFALSFDLKKHGKNDAISFDTVFSRINPTTSSPTTASKLVYPKNVIEYFSSIGSSTMEDIEEELEYYFSDLNIRSKKEKEALLKNLSKIISEAKKKDSENVERYVYEFFEIMEEKAYNNDDLGINQYIEPYINPILDVLNTLIKTALLFGVCFIFMVFIILTIFLLLFSIEKNTRKVE